MDPMQALDEEAIWARRALFGMGNFRVNLSATDQRTVQIICADKSGRNGLFPYWAVLL